MKYVSWAIVVLMILSVAARADNTMFGGAGIAGCATFADQYRGSRELVYFSWAQGFMAGLNATDVKTTGRARDISSISTAEQKGFLRSYCDAHLLNEHMYAGVGPLPEARDREAEPVKSINAAIQAIGER